MDNTPEFKKAAIDWLLANGTCDTMTTTTGSALADLAVRGVDYADSEAPEFRTVALDDGDSFTSATYGEAFAATIYPTGRDKTNWREEYTFWVGKDDLERLLLTNMIAGVIAAAETGDTAWKARANAREIERLERHRAAAALLPPIAEAVRKANESVQRNQH